jgi:hypothetical protein
VPVFREELWLEVKRENEAAAQAPEVLPDFPAPPVSPADS